MRRSEFIESRKNPQLNAKISINQSIDNLLKSTNDTVAGNVPNLFISFTDVKKLGVNPRPAAATTPSGIYAYPAEYVAKLTSAGENPEDTIPYAADRKYAMAFKASGNILNLGIKSDMQYARIVNLLKTIAKMYRLYQQYAYIEENSQELANNPKTLWNLTFSMANSIAEEKGGTLPHTWNALFRAVGVDGVCDPGTGTIHENEPTQAVFFTAGKLKTVELINNKYAPAQQQVSRIRGAQTHSAYQKMKEAVATGDVQAAHDALVADPSLIKLARSPSEFRLNLIKSMPGISAKIMNLSADEINAVVIADAANNTTVFTQLRNENEVLVSLAHVISQMQFEKHPNRFVTAALINAQESRQNEYTSKIINSVVTKYPTIINKLPTIANIPADAIVNLAKEADAITYPIFKYISDNNLWNNIDAEFVSPIVLSSAKYLRDDFADLKAAEEKIRNNPKEKENITRLEINPIKSFAKKRAAALKTMLGGQEGMIFDRVPHGTLQNISELIKSAENF